MVAHRTLTPFVRVRILHPLPKIQLHLWCGCIFLWQMWEPSQTCHPRAVARACTGERVGTSGARRDEVASRVRILHPLPTKNTLLSIKSVFFVYPSRRLGISSAVRWYITKNGKVVFVSHHAIGVYKIFLRLDEIQFLAELMIYSPCRLMICNTSCWWDTRLRLNVFGW